MRWRRAQAKESRSPLLAPPGSLLFLLSKRGGGATGIILSPALGYAQEESSGYSCVWGGGGSFVGIFQPLPHAFPPGSSCSAKP